MEEFPGIPVDFDGFKASPIPFDTSSCKELVLKNHSKVAVLFKVKCTSNKRVKIEECADILRPGNSTTVPITKLVDNVDGDCLHVIYTLVGSAWHDERMSVFRCWERAKKQNVPTRTVAVRIGKSDKEKGKAKDKEKEKIQKDEKDEKDREKSKSNEEE